MKNLKLALCDQDSDYITMFASYLMENYPGVSINIFTTPEGFFGDNQNFDVAIMTEDFAEITPFKKEGNISRRYLLSESKDSLAETDIYKFQSVDKILSKIEGLNDAIAGKNDIEKKNSDYSNIIGVYSPISHELQLPFSMALGQSYKEKGNVLFVDLEEISIFCDLIGESKNRNMMDLLYSLSVEETADEMEEYIGQFMGIDYICPFLRPDELVQIDESTWKKFFKLIKSMGYENIVVLFGRTINGFSNILEKMDMLYVLGKPGDYYRKGQDAFIRYAKNFLDEEKMINVMLPMSANNLTEGTYCIQELLQGNLGSFVKRLVA